MRDSSDKRFSRILLEGVTVREGQPVVFMKDERPYVNVTVYPSRKDFIDGTKPDRRGFLTRRNAAKIVRQLGAAVVEF